MESLSLQLCSPGARLPTERSELAEGLRADGVSVASRPLGWADYAEAGGRFTEQ